MGTRSLKWIQGALTCAYQSVRSKMGWNTLYWTPPGLNGLETLGHKTQAFCRSCPLSSGTLRKPSSATCCLFHVEDEDGPTEVKEIVGHFPMEKSWNSAIHLLSLFKFMALNDCLEGSSPLKPFCVSACLTWKMSQPSCCLKFDSSRLGHWGSGETFKSTKWLVFAHRQALWVKHPQSVPASDSTSAAIGMLSLHSCHLRKATRIG